MAPTSRASPTPMPISSVAGWVGRLERSIIQTRHARSKMNSTIAAIVSAFVVSSALAGSLVAQVVTEGGPAPAPRGSASLRLGRDSFVVRFQGMPEGLEVHEYTRTVSGYRYMSRFQIGPAFSHRAEVELDSLLNVLQARSETRVGALRGGSDVRYAYGRALGTAIPMQGSAAGPLRVDTLLPPGAFDGLALYPMLLGRHWRAGDADTVTLFDTDENTITSQSVRAFGPEMVQAAGAPTRALRLELTTTQLPVTLWISESTPHRLLKTMSANGETVLVAPNDGQRVSVRAAIPESSSPPGTRKSTFRPTLAR
jgi:hypothetical protein